MARSERFNSQSGGRSSTGNLKAILLATALVLSAGAFIILSDTEGSDASAAGPNLEWKVEGDTLIISGYGDMTYPGSLLPYIWFINDKQTVKHIVLKEGITSLAKGCFKFPNLTGEIVIPKSLKSIGNNVFEGTGITSIVFPEGSQLESIGSWAFRNCKELTGTLNLPDSLTYIGQDAFEGCSKLTGNVKIPVGMNYVNGGVFVGCASLSGNININPNVWFIAQNAFDGCTKITGKLELTHKVGLGVWDYAFRGCIGLTDVVISHCLSGIGEGAFEGCTGLKTVMLNDGRIGSRAFAGCVNLTELAIGSKITEITPDAFEGLSFYDEDGNELLLSKETQKEFIGYIFEGSNGKLTRTGATGDIIPDADEGNGIDLGLIALPIVFIVGLVAGLFIAKIRKP